MSWNIASGQKLSAEEFIFSFLVKMLLTIGQLWLCSYEEWVGIKKSIDRAVATAKLFRFRGHRGFSISQPNMDV